MEPWTDGAPLNQNFLSPALSEDGALDHGAPLILKSELPLTRELRG